MTTYSINNEYDKIVERMKSAKRILFITGAGISAESGLPTYRGIGGLYETENTEDNISIEKALSGTTMEQTPAITWKYLSQIESACRNATFNTAHSIIAAFQNHFESVLVLTQNIDGFHHKAGSNNIIDIHNGLKNLYCPNCWHVKKVSDYSELDSIPPECPVCSSEIGRYYLRPDVVLFGESLNPGKYSKLYDELKIGFDIVFSIGTTSIFPYISEPVIYLKHRKALTVEINPGITSISPIVDIRLRTSASMALQEIWNKFCIDK